MNKQTRKFCYGLILMVIAVGLTLLEYVIVKYHEEYWKPVVRLCIYVTIFIIGLSKIKQTTK